MKVIFLFVQNILSKMKINSRLRQDLHVSSCITKHERHTAKSLMRRKLFTLDPIKKEIEINERLFNLNRNKITSFYVLKQAFTVGHTIVQ